MSRTVHDLSGPERNAYEVWQSKLRDHTLSVAEHEQCRREIETLLWRGPNAQLLKLEAYARALETRIAHLESLVISPYGVPVQPSPADIPARVVRPLAQPVAKLPVNPSAPNAPYVVRPGNPPAPAVSPSAPGATPIEQIRALPPELGGPRPWNQAPPAPAGWPNKPDAVTTPPNAAPTPATCPSARHDAAQVTHFHPNNDTSAPPVAGPTVTDPAPETPAPKRGRPKGSRNKPKAEGPAAPAEFPKLHEPGAHSPEPMTTPVLPGPGKMWLPDEAPAREYSYTAPAQPGLPNHPSNSPSSADESEEYDPLGPPVGDPDEMVDRHPSNKDASDWLDEVLSE